VLVLGAGRKAAWRELYGGGKRHGVWVYRRRLSPFRSHMSEFAWLYGLRQRCNRGGHCLNLYVTESRTADNVWKKNERDGPRDGIHCSLQDLKSLEVTETSISDKGITRILGLRRLSGLSVAGTRVTIKGLVPLLRRTQLEYLSVGPEVDDEGMRYLASVQSLEELTVLGNDATLEGALQLKRLPRLRRLTLPGLRIDDKEMQRFAAFSALRELVIASHDGRRETKQLGFLRVRVYPFRG
jgi:hypothetical protein